MGDNRVCYRMETNPERWEKIDFKDLQKKDTFKLVEADGTLVGIFTATSEAFKDKDEIWKVLI